MTPLISITIPVFNEEDNLPLTYAELKRVTDGLTDYRFEFVFTDNHSSDRTFEILKELAARDRSVRAIRFSRNFGFQRSVLTGFRLARGEAAIQIDADLQDPPTLFGPMLEKWREGHDVVVGVRRIRLEHPFLHTGRKLYYRLLRYLGGDHLTVDAGDFRLIDGALIKKLRRIDDGHPYLRGLISSLARRQTSITYDRAKRMHGESKFPLRRLIPLAIDGIMAHSTMPLRIALYVGLSIAVLSTLLAFSFIVARLVFGQIWPAGFAATQILILFGIALNSVFLGVMGEYIGRIYDQVRLRPAVVVQDTLNFEEDISQIEAAYTWTVTAK